MFRGAEMNAVLIIDAMGSLTQMSSEIRARHQEYSAILHQETNGKCYLGIISPAKLDEAVNLSKSLKQWKVQGAKRFSLKFLFGVIRRIKNLELDQLVLVAADPWESYVSCRVIAMFSKRAKVPIQIQLHADIGDLRWRKFRKIFLVRSRLARFSIPRADSLRLVSHQQLNNLVDRKFKLPRETIIAPVPLNLPINFNLQPRIPRDNPIIVGLVGRLDSDRGLNEFVAFIKMLKQVNANFRIIVVGYGHLKEWLSNSLVSIVPSANVRFAEAQTSEQLSELWADITVLVSTAPAESFGRSIREALIHGVPVLAIPSSGVNEVAQLTDSISLINLESADETMNNLNRLLLRGVSLGTQEKLLTLNNGNSKVLVKSWERLLTGDTK